jgi:hypothetical protein
MRILLVVAAIAPPSISSAHKLYKWTDENGNAYYGDSLPPGYGSREYANRRRLELLGSQIKLTEVYLSNLRKRLVDPQAVASETSRALCGYGGGGACLVELERSRRERPHRAQQRPLAPKFLSIAIRSRVGLVVLEICWVDLRNLRL